MRKFIVAAVAAASFLAAASAADACVWVNPWYCQPVCYWGPFGQVCG